MLGGVMGNLMSEFWPGLIERKLQRKSKGANSFK